MKVFLYGCRGSGKSTIIQKLLFELGVKPCGFMTVCDTADNSGSRSVHIINAAGGDMPCDGNRAGRCYADGSWQSYPEVFDETGVELLTFGVRPDLVVMDEIGFMEADAARFQKRVLDILDSDYTVIGVIKPLHDAFMQRVLGRSDVKTIEVTKSGREKVFSELTEMYYNEQRYGKDLY